MTRSLISGLAWVGPVLSLELRRLFSYRVDFWASFFGRLAAGWITAYFLWQAIFDYLGEPTIGGFGFEAMMLYYVLIPLVSKIVMGPEMGFMSRDIYEGTLNRYLVYPLDFFTYKWVCHFAEGLIAVVQMALVVTVFAAVFEPPAGTNVTLATVAAGTALALLAGYLYFVMASLLEMVAFWQDNVWSLLVMLRFAILFLGGGKVPLSLFPTPLADALAYTPFPYLAGFPVRVMMGDVTPSGLVEGLGVLVFWSFVFTGLARLMWARGTKKYAGVGI